MHAINHISQLRGIIPPMVTPLLHQHKLDEKGISRLVNHMISGGVHGIFVLGTSGEAVSLSYRLREALLRQVAEEIAGRIPLLVGITDTSLEESINFAAIAQEVQADAVVAAPPFYFPTAQPALYDYFKTLAEEVPLPLFLYNIPSHARVVLEADTIRQLLALPNVAGYKDSTGDMMTFHRLQLTLKDQPEKVYLLGPEELLAESVLLGGHGGVNGGGNIFPQLYVQLYEAAVNREIERMTVLHRKVMAFTATVYQNGKRVIQGMKAALAALDICQDTVALPMQPLTKKEKTGITDYVNQMSIGF